MKKLCIFLTLAMLICLLAACGSITPDSPKPAESSQSETVSTQTDILYAVLYSNDVKEYPIEYTGAKKTVAELANELSKLTGLDFTVTASQVEDGWIVDWSADSTLIAGIDDREQKDEFHFFDADSLNWFMMDSLWRTLTENLNAENIYYTMDGGKELVFEKLNPVNRFPSDTPYMGSEFYSTHTDEQGDNLYACTEGLWRVDGETDTASIEMDGLGGFVMYYASGSVEATGYLKCIDEFENGNSIRYDLYTADDERIAGFYIDSETRLHIDDANGATYLLDLREYFQGFWEYPDGKILEINGDKWNLYSEDKLTLLADGPTKYSENACYLMNADGSSGGGRVVLDENNTLKDSDNILTYYGESLSGGSTDDVPQG